MSDLVIIDVNDGLKRVVNNKKLYAKLLTKFLDDDNLNKLLEALSCGELEEAQNYAHTLKGIAANLSLMELYKQSMEIEKQIKAGAIEPDQTEILKNTFSITAEEVKKVISRYE